MLTGGDCTRKRASGATFGCLRVWPEEEVRLWKEEATLAQSLPGLQSRTCHKLAPVTSLNVLP